MQIVAQRLRAKQSRWKPHERPLSVLLRYDGAYEQRKRHAILADRLGTSAKARRELTDGYSFAIDPKSVSLPEIREWIDLECRCCPFFRLGLSTEDGGWALTIEGPTGVKPFIQAELPQFFPQAPAP